MRSSAPPLIAEGFMSQHLASLHPEGAYAVVNLHRYGAGGAEPASPIWDVDYSAVGPLCARSAPVTRL